MVHGLWLISIVDDLRGCLFEILVVFVRLRTPGSGRQFCRTAFLLYFG
jgi:hypothetical protein